MYILLTTTHRQWYSFAMRMTFDSRGSRGKADIFLPTGVSCNKEHFCFNLPESPYLNMLNNQFWNTTFKAYLKQQSYLSPLKNKTQECGFKQIYWTFLHYFTISTPFVPLNTLLYI